MPAGPRTGDTRSPAGAAPAARVASATSCDRPSPSGRISDHTTALHVLPTHLELRLDQEDEIREGLGSGDERADDQAERDERQVRP